MTTHHSKESNWEEEFDERFNVPHWKETGYNLNYVKDFIRAELLSVAQETRGEEINENTSDGYHTFKELYDFRKVYNAALFNEWARQGKYDVHKSWRHHDGEECFGGGWFIVVAQLPTGQISNHYEQKDWDLFNVPIRNFAEKWDGHTPQDVLQRLLTSLTAPTKQ